MKGTKWFKPLRQMPCGAVLGIEREVLNSHASLVLSEWVAPLFWFRSRSFARIIIINLNRLVPYQGLLSDPLSFIDPLSSWVAQKIKRRDAVKFNIQYICYDYKKKRCFFYLLLLFTAGVLNTDSLNAAKPISFLLCSHCLICRGKINTGTQEW